MNFKPVEANTAVYKKIVSQIQEMVMNGSLRKGDRLPPERQLAETLNVGRPALKQAISALEMMGIITSRQGDGNYITSDYVDVFNPLAMRFYLENGDMDDVLEFRYTMEVQMASLAAMKITDEQIEDFAQFMEDLRDESKSSMDLERRTYLNNVFHARIVDICGNPLMKSIYLSIMGLISEQIKFTDGVEFYESHQRIFEAIRDHDPKRAAYYMSMHFKNKFPNYQYYRDMQEL